MRYTVPLTITIDADSPEQARYRAESELIALALTVDSVRDYDIAPVSDITESVRLIDWIAQWNFATDPSVARTDKEHDECKARATAIRAEMANRGYVQGIDYRETEDGRLRPLFTAGRV